MIARRTLPLALALVASLPGLSRGAAADPTDRRVEALLAQLTLTEKIQLVGGNEFESRALPRLGIPPLTMADGPVGVRGAPATAFPAGIAMAATWDPALVGRAAGAIAVEARAQGRRMLLGPCVNIARVPLGGRVFESFGEDPYLTARLAVAYVQSVQAQGVAATTKHFAANNQEWMRESIDARIDERALHEIYFPAFEAAVKEGGSWAVMSAYNKLNGRWCSENRRLLRDVLKSAWGFRGLTVSDWGAVHSTVATLDAGLDLEMPTGIYLNERDLSAALKSGAVTEADLDDAVRRLLRVLAWTGLLDQPAASPAEAVDDVRHREIARTVARESLVLLRNERSTLPLDRRRVRSIAVIGPNAAVARTGGGGSSHVTPSAVVTPLAAMQRAAGPGIAIHFAPGATMAGDVEPIEPTALRSGATAEAAPGLRGEYFTTIDLTGVPAIVRLDPQVSFDWGSLSPAPELPVDRYSVRWSGVLVAPTSGSYELSVRGDDGVRLTLAGRKVLDDWSDHGARTAATQVTLEAGRAYELQLEYYENGGGAMVQLGWRKPGSERLAQAVATARDADVAVVFAGTSENLEGEGFDRASLALPEGQAELISAVLRANPRTVVVLQGGGPLTMGDLVEQVPALLAAWYPGQEGGTAIAEVLFGDANPSGKLPITFPRRFEDSPAFPTYPGKELVADHSDGIFIGYRHFDRGGPEPQFPFGHGLSYTTFRFSDLQLERPAGDLRVLVRFTVANSGGRPGAEVAQIYVRDLVASLPRPVRELKGFARVELAPGESRTVTLTLDERAFALFDPVTHQWRVEPGTFEIEVGSSSRSLPLKGRLEL